MPSIQTATSFLLAAGGGVHPLVEDLGMCIVVSAVFGVLFERLRIPTIAALLGAGVLIGPVGLSLVDEQSNIETIANLGLTLLLFVIGLEVHVGNMLASGRVLVLTGVLQVPLTIALGGLAFLLLRMAQWGLLEGPYVPLYLGAACAFSSTLLVVKLLQERLKLDSVSGRLCIGLLIFQDVWAIVFLAVQPSLESPELGPLGLTFAGIAVVIAVAWAASRWLLPPAFRVVAKVPELVVTLALGWCFGLGLFGARLGDILGLLGLHVPITVSLEMGALIAGASLAASPYTYEVVAKVSSLRDFFVTLFFVGLGMSIPAPNGVDLLILAAVLSVLAITMRYLVFLPLLYTTGLNRRHALETSTKLAQVSEFCLVIAYLGLKLGHIDEQVVSSIIFAFVLTALVTPALFTASDRLYDKVHPLMTAVGMRPVSETAATEVDPHGDAPRVVVLGFHRIAAALLHDLSRDYADILPRVLVIDFNVALHDKIRALGAQVIYGDIANPETLKHARVSDAELVISTVPDELLKKTSNATIAQAVRAINPSAVIIAHATRVSDVPKLLAAGATDVFMAPVEAAAALLPAVCATLNGNIHGYLASQAVGRGTLQNRSHVLD
jgi:Kef-type K+ transport system membrane component KefB